MGINVAGDKVGDHFQRNVLELIGPGVEHTAPDGLVMGNGVIVCVVLLAAVQLGVCNEHAHELDDGRVDHAAIVPCGGLQSLAAHTFHAAVEPVQNGQIGLADPAVAPYALCKVHDAAVLHNVHDHVDVVIQPDVIEVVHRVLYAAPLSVLVKAGLIFADVSQTALTMGLAVPEVLHQLLVINALLSHLTCPPGSS